MEAPDFNPRPLAGATNKISGIGLDPEISIHAPLRGRLKHLTWNSKFKQFQSTPPCGGDLATLWQFLVRFDFNPRPLAGATHSFRKSARVAPISIHAPLRGRPVSLAGPHVKPDFNPRPLAGATKGGAAMSTIGDISIHAPLRGRQVNVVPLWNHKHISIHAPLRGRRYDAFLMEGGNHISIHAPLRGRPGVAIDGLDNYNFNPRPLAGAT